MNTPTHIYLQSLKAYAAGETTRTELAKAARAYYAAQRKATAHQHQHQHNLQRARLLVQRYRHNRTANLYEDQEADDIAYERVTSTHARALNEYRVALEARKEEAYQRKVARLKIALHPVTHLPRRVPYLVAKDWEGEHLEHECP